MRWDISRPEGWRRVFDLIVEALGGLGAPNLEDVDWEQESDD
jgi:hypothetical protein